MKFSAAALVGSLTLCSPAHSENPFRPRIDLTGEWQFYTDVGDAALAEVNRPPARIIVPGAWQAQGFGTPGGSIPSSVIGADITPAPYLRHNLTARCLYVRTVPVPSSWREYRVFLCVRRAYRHTDVTVNGRSIGNYEGFSSPFEFDITEALRFGGDNELVLGVDNRPRAGRDVVGMGNYFSNTGGIGGAVYLEARPRNRLRDVFAVPNIAAAQARLRIALHAPGETWDADWSLTAEIAPWNAAGNEAAPSRAEAPIPIAAPQELTVELPVGIEPLRLWSPEDPFLYVATVCLVYAGKIVDQQTVRFGMREITAWGTRLLLNGRPLYLAGYGDDNTEPLTGMAPSDKMLYLKRLRLMRSYGFNFVRHHSFFPHDEYLEAADEVGLLVQPEACMGYTKFWSKAHGLFIEEWPRIIAAYRNHPCVWAWCTGNEFYVNQLPARAADSPPASEFTREDGLAILEQAYRVAKNLDPTRLVHASDGGHEHPWTDVLSDPDGSRSKKPYLLHEYGNYTCTLPDFSLIPRLTGVIRPLTYERAASFVTEKGLEKDYGRYYRSSLAMRSDAQKHFLEAARLAGDNTGFSYWLGTDFPDSPEGCWDEGCLNQLWEPKPGLTENLAKQTGPTVLLAGAPPNRRIFYSDALFTTSLLVSHYGPRNLEQARATWRLKENEIVLHSGELAPSACATGELTKLGDVAIPALGGNTPRFVTLECELYDAGHFVTQNSWEYFAYPHTAPKQPLAGVYSEIGALPGAAELQPGDPLPSDLRVLIVDQLDHKRHRGLVLQGKAAILLLGAGGFKEIKKRDRYFLSAYGGAYGGVVEDHPIFAAIPHQYRIHPGMYQIIAGGRPLDAETMPDFLRSGAIVHGLGLSDWIQTEKTLQRSVMFCETVTERGLHLVLCNLDLRSDDPACRYLLWQTLNYLLAGEPAGHATRCTSTDLASLLR